MPGEKLLVFGRYPRLGKVKTRLTSLLTDQGCCRLQEALLLDTADRICRLPVDRYLYLAGATREEVLQVKLHFSCAIQVRLQQGSDLGERMWQAYCEVTEAGDRVIFLGTDSPSLPLSYIRAGLEALSRVSAVIGPAQDGGYFLLGLSQPNRELFRGIPWGSSGVFQETVAKLAGQDYEILPEWYDIDRENDLSRLLDDLEERFEGFPRRTKAFLESWRSSA